MLYIIYFILFYYKLSQLFILFIYRFIEMPLETTGVLVHATIYFMHIKFHLLYCFLFFFSCHLKILFYTCFYKMISSCWKFYRTWFFFLFFFSCVGSLVKWNKCKCLMHAFSTYENYNIGKEIALYWEKHCNLYDA